MQFWQSLFLCENEQIFDATRISEAVGFDGIQVSDHLVHPEIQNSTYLYSPDGKPPSFTENTPWPDCWSILAALGAVSPTLRLCTNVYILPLRNPIEVAKTTATVGYVSNGRLAIGAGAGWMKEEFDILGVDWKSRGRRYDECIEVMRKLYSGAYVEHHGEFFDFPRMMINPVPAQPVPILIGGISKPALRRAARLGDGWIGPGQTIEGALATLAEIDALRREHGTRDRPFEAVVSIWGDPLTPDAVKRLEDVGATGMVSLPFAFMVAPQTTLDQKRAYLETFANDVIAKVTR